MNDLKPPISGNIHRLPFEALAPSKFEELCLWLVRREGYQRAEHLGEAGGDDGRDIVAWDGQRRVVFQCKRVVAFGLATAKKEIAKLRGLPAAQQPDEIVFVVSSAVSAKTRTGVRNVWGDEASCHFWASSELDERVKRHPEILEEFFLSAQAARKLPFASPLPQLPKRWVPRPMIAGTVIRAFKEGAAQVGLIGMGGSGKTVLAAAVARDEVLARLFPDGIVWLSVGHSDPLALLGVLARVLSTEILPVLPNWRTGRDLVRGLASGRRFLLVLDDVWTIDQAAALDVIGHGSGLLATSRLKPVLDKLGALPIDIDVMSAAEAETLLTNWGAPSSELATAIALRCGYLPLALAMAGALARRPNRTWQDALNLLCDADLEGLEALFPDYEHPTLLAALRASIEDLPASERDSYLALVAFGKDWIPASTLAAYWGNADLVSRFVEKSLLFLDEEKRVRLHDLQADYVRLQAGDPAPFHAQFVAAMRRRIATGDFASATDTADDGYFFERLPFHLSQAGLGDELRRLLFDHGWLLAKLSACGVNAVLADFGYTPESAATMAVEKALRLAASVLGRDPQQLANQLLARLSPGDDDVDRLLESARAWGTGRTWLRPTRPGLRSSGGCLEQEIECPAVVVHLANRGNILEVFCDDGYLRRWDVEVAEWVGSESYAGLDRAEESWPPGAETNDAVGTWLDDTRFVVGLGYIASNGGLRVWSSTLGGWDGEVIKHPHWAHCVTALAVLDDRHVVTGALQSHIALWDLEKRTFVHQLEGHANPVRSLVRFDAHRFASAGEDRTIRVWDVSKQARAADLLRHTSRISAVLASASGVVSTDHVRTLFRSYDGSEAPCELGSESGWTNLDKLADDLVAVTRAGHDLQLWRLAPLGLSYSLYETWKCSIAVVDEQSFVVGYGRELHLWSNQGPDLVGILGPLPDLSEDGLIRDVVVIGQRYIAASVLYRYIVVFDLRTGAQVGRLDDNRICFITLVSPYIVYESADGYRAWDFATGANFRVGNASGDPKLARGAQLLMAAMGSVTVVDLLTQTHTTTAVERSWDSPLAWLDDSHIVTGDVDGQVRVWELGSGRIVTSCSVDGVVSALAVANRFIAVGDQSGSVQIYLAEGLETSR